MNTRILINRGFLAVMRMKNDRKNAYVFTVMKKKINIMEGQLKNIRHEFEKMRADTCEFKLAEVKKLAKENIYKAFDLGRKFENDNPINMDGMTEDLDELQRLTAAIDIMV